MNPSRALVVVAHPDDEAWLFGGTIATWTARGVAVRVLCLTAGEKGGDRRGLVVGDDELAALRRGELDASCAALGAQGHCAGLPDGGLAMFPVERGEAVVTEQIESFAPDLILTHGPLGEYGHLDHIAAHTWTRAASVPVWVPALPSALMYPVWRRLRRVGFDGVRNGLSEAALHTTPSASIPLAAAASAAKGAAVAAHASQLRDGEISSFLLPGLLDGLLHEELYAC